MIPSKLIYKMGAILDMISVPFGVLIGFFYSITGNYAFALFFFTIAVHIVLLPLAIKQQKNQVKMGKIRPKEMVIRKKYAGRKDAATQQKMNLEVQDMYRRENYSMMGGCMPMLLQLPIIFALFNIVRQPLTYIAGFSSELIERIRLYIGDAIVENTHDVEIQIVRAFENNLEGFYGNLETIRSAILPEGLVGISEEQIELFRNYQNIDFRFFGQTLLIPPAEALFSSLAVILILNVATSFLQMRITRKLQARSMPDGPMNNKSMKIMEYTMPLMIVYFTYVMNAALGLYWIYRSIASIGQTIVLAKIYPIPETTEEDIKRAEEQYGDVKKKKKKKKKPAEIAEIAESEEAVGEDKEDDAEAGEESETIAESEESRDDDNKNDKDDKGNKEGENTSKNKAGKRYTVKRRNSDK